MKLCGPILIWIFFIGYFPAIGQAQVHVVGAMKDAMWKGEIQGKVSLDSIVALKGIYGVGPIEFMKGEIMIVDSEVYNSVVSDQNEASVFKNPQVKAPFFVYTQVQKWEKATLPQSVKDIPSLEAFLLTHTGESKKPFVFKLTGKVSKATIHIQNLPEGSIVQSPKDAHEGQVKYHLENENCTILGFFSTQHQGIFTHHDSYVHLHLINKDKTLMGHLDELGFRLMELYLGVE